MNKKKYIKIIIIVVASVILTVLLSSCMRMRSTERAIDIHESKLFNTRKKMSIKNSPNLRILPLDEGLIQDGKKNFVLDIKKSTDTPNTSFTTYYYDNNSQQNNYTLGPVFKVKKGDVVSLIVNNTLSIKTSLHVHGIRNMPSRADGVFYPIGANASDSVQFRINQTSGTSWFHPHVHGTVSQQLYKGLAGVFLIEDEDNALEKQLPNNYGKDDFTLVLTDKKVDREGNVIYDINNHDYAMRGYRGNAVLVNWQLQPKLEVPKGIVRFRLLNASTSQELRVKLNNKVPMYLIASGGGLLPLPQEVNEVFLVAGNRAEILVDTKKLKNKGVFFEYEGSPIMRLYPKTEQAQVQSVPASSNLLAEQQKMLPKKFAETKKFVLAGASMGGMMGGESPFTINDESFSKSKINVTSKSGTWEKWTIKGARGHHAFEHSFHIHSSQFLVMSVNKKSPSIDYLGWQDTVYVAPGDEVELAVKIGNEKGLYVYHCHILEHEDVGMMGILQIN